MVVVAVAVVAVAAADHCTQTGLSKITLLCCVAAAAAGASLLRV